MARGVNKVILIGNLGSDPEVRYTPSGNAVANISLATSEAWRDKQSGDLQERTEWHRVVFFNRLAEIVGEFLRKGSKVYIEGSLRTRKWQDKSGVEKFTTEIIATEMHMLDSRGGSGSGSFGPEKYSAKPQAPSSFSGEGRDMSDIHSMSDVNPMSAASPVSMSLDSEDDVPF